MTREQAITYVDALVASNVEERWARGEVIGAEGVLHSVEKGQHVWHNSHGKGWVIQVVQEDGEHAAIVQFKGDQIEVVELPSPVMEVWRD